MEAESFKAAMETGKYDYLSQEKISCATRQAYALETAIGKSMKITEVDPKMYQARLEPFSETNFELAMQKYVKNGNNGEVAVTKTDFETVLGHPLMPLANAVKSNL